jgi:hypothetical protein
VCRYRAHRAHNSREHATFKGPMTPLVLSSTPTPARFVGGRKGCWRGGRRRRTHWVQGYGSQVRGGRTQSMPKSELEPNRATHGL